MDIYYNFLKALEDINYKIEYYKKEIAALPEGTLTTSKRKRGMAYFQNIDHKQIYIKSSNVIVAEQLALKKYLQKKVDDLINDKTILEGYLEQYKAPTANNYIAENERLRVLLQKNSAISKMERSSKSQSGLDALNDPVWISKVAKDPVSYKILQEHIIQGDNGKLSWDYNGSNLAMNQELREIKTMCGVKVRSKSEAIIADALFNAGILFVYEPQYNSARYTCYPDFYIFHPRNGYGIILEHAGMLIDRCHIGDYSDQEKIQANNYTQMFSKKIQKLVSDGWAPGVNLFFTGETKFQRFNTSGLKVIINEHLLD